MTKVAQSKKKPGKQRNWCFTDFEMLDWEAIYEENKDFLRYIGFGKETCPKTQRVHYQGWMQFKTQKRMTAIKKVARSKKLHLEPCYGSVEANEKYCRKDNNFKSFGTFKCQGQRTDVEMMVKLIGEGKSTEEIASHNPSLYIQYHNGIGKYKQLIDKKLRSNFRKIEVIVLSGETGTGKTRKAMEHAKYKIQGCALKWWDDYDGEECILIDEYSNDIKVTELLSILDGYQLRLPIKGGFTYANWTKVYITTNLKEFHENAREVHRDALDRRITKWLEVPLR